VHEEGKEVMGGPGSGHGIKRPDHTAKGIETIGLKRKQIKGLPSVFSGLPDPSLHREVVRRKNLSAKEMEMKIQRSKEIALEARDLQDLCRQFTLKATERLVQILDNPDASDGAVLKAIEMLWDRGFGKAAITQVNINANADAKPSELDATSLDRRIADAIHRVEKLTDRTSEEGTGEKRPSDIRKYN